MSISIEKFQAIKDLIQKFQLNSFLSEMDAPLPYFDASYAVSKNLPKGQAIGYKNYVPYSFIDKAMAENRICFDLSAYDEADNSLNIHGQKLYPNEEQLAAIKKDNFGAVKMGAFDVFFFTKEEHDLLTHFEKNRDLQDRFNLEVTRLKPMLEVYEEFDEIKRQANQYGVADHLNQWDAPVFPPNPINDLKTPISLDGHVSQSYLANTAKRWEISYSNVIENSKVVAVDGVKFKLNDEQLAQLKADDYAYIFAVMDVLYITNKQQKLAYEHYDNAFNNYSEFRKAYNWTKQAIFEEKCADESKLQHDRLEKLPFSYFVTHKVNLRMLHGRGIGSGAKKNAVFHIMTDEDFSQGRFKRKKEQFLCGGYSSYNGETRSENAHEIDSKRLGTVPYKVTCEKCLEIAERFIK